MSPGDILCCFIISPSKSQRTHGNTVRRRYLRTMRKKLGQSEGERKRFRATFTRLGKKVNYNGYSEDTILLTGIVDVATGTTVADHVWFSYTRGFEAIRLQPGTVIAFDARVKIYNKGYVNRQLNVNQRRQDYKLSHPTRIEVVTASQESDDLTKN